MTEQNSRGVSRRSITKGVAWAAPVVAVAAAAPFAAASYDTPPIGFKSKSACKFPGSSTSCEKAYRFVLSVTNPVAFPITLNIISVTEDGQFSGNFTVMNAYSNLETGTVIPVGGAQEYILVVGPGKDSANTSAKICMTYTYSYTNNAGQVITAYKDPEKKTPYTVCFDYTKTDPCVDGLCAQL
ncbi:hypothetical protein ACXA45_01630 [Neomicrococcus lactis]